MRSTSSFPFRFNFFGRPVDKTVEMRKTTRPPRSYRTQRVESQNLPSGDDPATEAVAMTSIQSTGFSSALYAQRTQTTPVKMSDQMKEDFTEALKSAGVSESDIPALLEEIQQTVDEVVASGSANGRRDVIKQAVDQVLEKNGVDTEKFGAAMQARRPGGPPPPPPGGAPVSEEDSVSLFDSVLNSTDEENETTLLELILQNLDKTGSLFDAEA